MYTVARLVLGKAQVVDREAAPAKNNSGILPSASYAVGTTTDRPKSG